MPKMYFSKNEGTTYIGTNPKPVKIIKIDFDDKIVYKRKNDEDDDWVLIIELKPQIEDYFYTF